LPKNYRPVALTSHIIKVFERVVRKALVHHIDQLGLLPEGQHGSRSRRSTLTQLLAHWDSVLDGLESGDGVDYVYLDFSKPLTRWRLVCCCTSCAAVKSWAGLGAGWLPSSAQKKRKQAVTVESPVISGVPQGTCTIPAANCRYSQW
jgi:hypothetical protein